jgi:hypothetical protein
MSSSTREREPPTSLNNPSVPAAFTVPAVDGYPIRGLRWREVQDPSKSRPMVIVNAATSVRCRYYYRFAAFLFTNGFELKVQDVTRVFWPRGTLRWCSDRTWGPRGGWPSGRR